jgi:hypothetical protein
MKPNKKKDFALEAIHKQFEITGIDPSVLESDPESWFNNNTMTQTQHESWKDWFIVECRKRFRTTKKMAEKEFAWFDLAYGLRIIDEGTPEN